jgi:hypothetical protein
VNSSPEGVQSLCREGERESWGTVKFSPPSCQFRQYSADQAILTISPEMLEKRRGFSPARRPINEIVKVKASEFGTLGFAFASTFSGNEISYG